MEKRNLLEWRALKVEGQPPGELFAHSACTVDDKIWLFGGYGGQYLEDVYTWQPDSMIWRKETITGQLPHKRCAHTSSVIKKCLYIFGGFDGKKQYNDLYILDTEERHCKKVETINTPPPHCYHAAAVIGNKIYIFGGWDGKVRMNSLFMLDPEKWSGDKLEWQKLSVAGKAPKRRAASTASAIGNKIYIFGGTNGNSMLNDIHILDTVTLEWIKPQLKGREPGAHGYHSASVVNNKIFFLEATEMAYDSIKFGFWIQLKVSGKIQIYLVKNLRLEAIIAPLYTTTM